MSAPPVDAPWMYMYQGQIAGPASQLQLAQLYQNGYIPMDCPVLHAPSSRWMRLNEIPGMFAPAYPLAYQQPPAYQPQPPVYQQYGYQQPYAGEPEPPVEYETFPVLR